YLTAGSTLVATGTQFRDNHEIGVGISGSTASLDGCEVTGTLADSVDDYGHGITVEEDATLWLNDSVVRDNLQMGINISDSTVTL
ncbi:MAG: hypothetical protein QGG40_22585, partial [Myxococcota bacterium]|nr:hypothetical protein [Myxococcota bacterium]